MNYKKYFILIISGYIFFIILLTYPIAFNITSLAGPNGDNLMFSWNMWWAKKALIELNTDPFQTDYIFYPNTVSLIYHTFSPFNNFISIPLQYIFSLAVTYNLILISTFLFSAIGAYLLAYYFTKNRLASFIAGLIFSFCPYHFAHAECHLNHASMQFIPFSILYLVKLYDYPRIRYAILSGIFLILNFYSCYYYGVFLAIFIALFLIYWFFNDIFNWRGTKKIINKRFIWCFIFAIFIFILGTSPLLYLFVKEGLTRSGVYAGGQEGYVSDLIGLFTPSLLHTLFRHTQWLNSICSRFTGCLPEYTVFLGYTVLFLSLVSMFRVKNKWKWFWGFSGLFFIILSFGPNLHILGKTYFRNLYLPYYWSVQIVPFFKQARCPSRFIVIAMLSLSVLAGYGFTYIFNRLRTKKGRLAVFTIICMLVSFEFSTLPLRQTHLKIPKFYYELSKDGQDYAILEFPVFMCDSSQGLYMFLQTIHQKKILNGWISRLPPDLGSVLDEVSKLSKSSLRKYNIKYIIVHKDLIEGARNLYWGNLLEGDVQKYIFDLLENEKRFGKLPIEDEDIVVYKVLLDEEVRDKVDTELLYIFDKKGGEFQIEEDGVYLIKAKVSAGQYLDRIKEEVVFNFRSEQDLNRWRFNPTNATYKYSKTETDGLCLSAFFDGSEVDDEYVQMRLEGIDVDLKRYPYFYLAYKIEDPGIQTIELVAGVDFNGDGIVDEHIRGLYPMPASKDISRYIINLYDRIKDRIPKDGNPNVIVLELYPHKMWGRDCTSSGDRGIYRFWINRVGFYGCPLAKGREVVTSVKDIGAQLEDWEVRYYPKGYELTKKRNSMVISQFYPCMELSRLIDTTLGESSTKGGINMVDLQTYTVLDMALGVEESSGLHSIEPILEIDINGDSLSDAQISLGELLISNGFNRHIIDIREGILDHFPGIVKCFLTKIRLRLNMDEEGGYNSNMFWLNRIKLYSKGFIPTKGFVFRKPVFRLDGRVCWFYSEFSKEEDAGRVLFSKEVFLKRGRYSIKNMLGDGLDYVAVERRG